MTTDSDEANRSAAAAELCGENAGANATPPALSMKQETMRQMIVDALSECDGNMSLAAKRIGIDRRTLYRHMARFDIRAEHYRTGWLPGVPKERLTEPGSQERAKIRVLLKELRKVIHATGRIPKLDSEDIDLQAAWIDLLRLVQRNHTARAPAAIGGAP